MITNGDEWVGLWKGPWDKAIHVSWNKIDTLLYGAQIDWSSVKRTQKKKTIQTWLKMVSLFPHIFLEWLSFNKSICHNIKFDDILKILIK